MTQPAQGKPLIRGLALVNDWYVFERIYGADAVRALRATLSEPQRAALDAGFIPGHWYEEDIQIQLCRFVTQHYGEAATFALGVRIGQHIVGRVHRFLARIAGPERALRRSAALWSYWRDTGRQVVERSSNTAATVLVLDHPPMTDSDNALAYAGAAGYIMAASGAKDVRMAVEVQSPRSVAFHVAWGGETLSGGRVFSVDEAVGG